MSQYNIDHKVVKKRLGREDFIKLSKEKHGDKYDYTNTIWINQASDVHIFCKRCNQDFKVRAQHHSNKNYKWGGCQRCAIRERVESKTTTFEEFLKKATDVHGGRYSYIRKDEIKNNTTKMDIICEKHGIFKQTIMTHLAGGGCTTCGRREWYKKTCITADIENLDGVLYLIHIQTESENFLKLGVTTSTVDQRYSKLKYPYEVLFEYKTNILSAFEKEQKIHRSMRNKKYKPRIAFGGHRECYNTESLEEIITLIKEEL